MTNINALQLYGYYHELSYFVFLCMPNQIMFVIMDCINFHDAIFPAELIIIQLHCRTSFASAARIAIVKDEKTPIRTRATQRWYPAYKNRVGRSYSCCRQAF